MQGRMFGVWVFAAALCMSGCAAYEEQGDTAEVIEVSGPSLSTEESASTIWCTNKGWRVDFYAEPELVNRVGWIQCNCWQPQQRSGTISSYTALAYEHLCDLN